jgi:hypothetical protein
MSALPPQSATAADLAADARPVWRGLTVREVRSQFDNSLAVPDGARFVESCTRRS